MEEKKLFEITIESKEKLTLEKFVSHIQGYISNDLNEDAVRNFIDEIIYMSDLDFDKDHDSYYATIQVKTKRGYTNGTLRISDHLLDQKIWFEMNLQFGISIVITDKFKERNKDEKQYEIKVYEYQFKDSEPIDADILGKFIKNMFVNNSKWDIKNIDFGTIEDPYKNEVGCLIEKKEIYNKIMKSISEILKDILKL